MLSVVGGGDRSAAAGFSQATVPTTVSGMSVFTVIPAKVGRDVRIGDGVLDRQVEIADMGPVHESLPTLSSLRQHERPPNQGLRRRMRTPNLVGGYAASIPASRAPRVVSSPASIDRACRGVDVVAGGGRRGRKGACPTCSPWTVVEVHVPRAWALTAPKRLQRGP